MVINDESIQKDIDKIEHNIKSYLSDGKNFSRIIRNGLKISSVINDILNPYKSELSSDEIENFIVGLTKLRKTDYFNGLSEDLMRFKNMSESDILKELSKKSNIKIRGEWHVINKFETNYIEISKLLAHLIVLTSVDVDKKYNPLFSEIRNLMLCGRVDEGFKKMKSLTSLELTELITKHCTIKNKVIDSIISRFTSNIVQTTIRGTKRELISDKFVTLKDGWKIYWSGGDGNLIDIIFGVDRILEKDGKYKTQQIKSNIISDYDKERYTTRYNVDILTAVNDESKFIVMLDLKTNKRVQYNENDLGTDFFKISYEIGVEHLKKKYPIYTPINEIIVIKINHRLIRVKILDNPTPNNDEIEEYKNEKYINILLYVDVSNNTVKEISVDNYKSHKNEKETVLNGEIVF
jgi:hypothetical protein